MPDVKIKAQVYKDPRPPEYFEPFHERTRTREPEAKSYEIVRTATALYALIAFRARAIGTENVPNGPVILAPNHASFMDHFFIGDFLRRRVQFMAKSQLFKPGPLQWIFTHGGVFPVRRGLQDDEAIITSSRILQRGGALVMYCEGGRSRTGNVAEQARPGIGRIALESGAPVVPVGVIGSQQVRNWKRLQFPRVTVRFGEPIRYPLVESSTREQQQEVADDILVRIRALHDELQRLGHRGALRAARGGGGGAVAR